MSQISGISKGDNALQYSGAGSPSRNSVEAPDIRLRRPDKPVSNSSEYRVRNSGGEPVGIRGLELNLEKARNNRELENATRPVKTEQGHMPNAAFRPTEFWKNRGAFFNGDGDRVELDNRLRGKSGGELTTEKIQSFGECKTCENRKYADRSDDASVSFQTPTKLDPSTAAVKVAAHENEHVHNERADAAREGREIISQTVTMRYACCPECGTSYVAGGQTRTVTSGEDGGEDGRDGQKQQDVGGKKNTEIA